MVTSCTFNQEVFLRKISLQTILCFLSYTKYVKGSALYRIPVYKSRLEQNYLIICKKNQTLTEMISILSLALIYEQLQNVTSYTHACSCNVIIFKFRVHGNIYLLVYYNSIVDSYTWKSKLLSYLSQVLVFNNNKLRLFSIIIIMLLRRFC